MSRECVPQCGGCVPRGCARTRPAHETGPATAAPGRQYRRVFGCDLTFIRELRGEIGTMDRHGRHAGQPSPGSDPRSPPRDRGGRTPGPAPAGVFVSRRSIQKMSSAPESRGSLHIVLSAHSPPHLDFPALLHTDLALESPAPLELCCPAPLIFAQIRIARKSIETRVARFDGLFLGLGL